MAMSPPIKLYRGGAYIGAMWHTEDAAAVCGMSPETEARLGHSPRLTIYREPADAAPWAASNSWDAAAAVMRHNMDRIRRGESPVLRPPFPWDGQAQP